jgi:hypothetical protein
VLNDAGILPDLPFESALSRPFFRPQRPRGQFPR